MRIFLGKFLKLSIMHFWLHFESKANIQTKSNSYIYAHSKLIKGILDKIDLIKLTDDS